jgi:hypothetical protein
VSVLSLLSFRVALCTFLKTATLCHVPAPV